MSTRGSALDILLYGVDYAPDSTGIPKYTGELGTWLAARGHRVEAIAGMPYYPEWRVPPAYRARGFHTETIEGVRVHRTPIYVPEGRAVRTRHRVLLDLSFLAASARRWLPVLLRRGRYDVVLAVCPSVQSGYYPLAYRALRGVPWVFHLQDLQVDAALSLGMLGRRLLRRPLLAAEAFLLRRATRVTTVTEAMRRRIVDKGVPAERVWLLPNWADTEGIHPDADGSAFRRELGLGPDDVLALYAGAMGEKQGLEQILEVAERLRSRPRIRFALAGDGSARPRIEAEARRRGLDRVAFLPVQPRARLAELLAAGDVHLVVQRAGAADLMMPSKLTNILAAGRPAIATAAAGTELHRVITDGDLGRVSPPEDAAALAEAVRELAARPELRHEMGRRGRAHATRHLDRERILQEFQARLVELVAGVPAPVAALGRTRPPVAGRDA